MSHNGAVRMSTSEADGNASLSPTAHAMSASPPGYFDGMPGRPLGSSAENRPRSPPPPYPGNINGVSTTNGAATAAALAAVEDRDEKASGGVRLLKTTASLSPERDAKEERRAWAQRAGVGRVARTTPSKTVVAAAKRAPPVSSGAGLAAAEQEQHRKSVSIASSRPGRNITVGGHGINGRSKSTHQQRGRESSPFAGRTTAAAAEAGMGFAPPDASGSKTNGAATDVVSQAFERYAKGRDEDEHRLDGPTGQERPRQRPSSAPFALSPRTGGYNHQQHEESRASSDNEDGLGSGGSLAAGNDHDYTYPFSFHHAQRQTQRGRRREAPPPLMPPSELNRDGFAGHGRGRQAAGINSGDEGGGRTREGSSQRPPSDKRGRSVERERTAENRGGRRSYDGGGEDEAWEEIGDDGGDVAISGSERERALRKAFDMYDLNGDGFITYLEVGGAPKIANTRPQPLAAAYHIV